MIFIKAIGTAATGFVRAKDGPFRCGNCRYMVKGVCIEPEVIQDPELQHALDANGHLPVKAGDCCNEFEPVEKEKNAMKKFIPFVKVDEKRREVWGIVTAEVPDKDNEVCDYAGSKPHYQAVIDEMSKATNGENFFPLRAMHALTAAGKCIGFEFRDVDKEIFMGFKVVDEDEWRKVLEKVYTGFSQGGKKVSEWPDTTFAGCMRYIAKPSEVSLVDNPCLATAHFTLVRSDGSVELQKFSKVEREPEPDRLAALEREVAMLKAQTTKTSKTKRVAGEDLPASAFLIVGEPEKTETWKLPVKFSSEEKTKRHIRNALARFNQLKDVSAEDKKKAWNKLTALARQYDISDEDEKKKVAAVLDYLRKRARIFVNRQLRTNHGADIGHSLTFLDEQIGKVQNALQKDPLQKGMYEVSRLAEYVQGLAYLLYSVINEQQWEKDTESPLPSMLQATVDDLMDTLLAMVQEETTELRAEVNERRAAAVPSGPVAAAG